MAAPTPAPGEQLSLGLALVNTELTIRGASVDLLADPLLATRWLEARGLDALGSSPVCESDLIGLRQLRSAIRAAFVARIVGTPVDRESLDTLNAASVAWPRAPQLSWEADGPALGWAGPGAARGVEVVVASIAADAIRVVSGPSGETLRACDAHGCVRMFLQDHGRRQWCSRTCGDRVRVARHYQKARRERI